MTTTTDDTTDAGPLDVGELVERRPRDPLELLTVNELAMASRRLGADVLHVCSTEGHAQRWDALALVAWLLAKRTDQGAKLDTFRDMTADELGRVLVPDEDEPADVLEAAAADPTVQPA